jgi:1-acyl-sn-glycerol-3-phosphate acyltransferase
MSTFKTLRGFWRLLYFAVRSIYLISRIVLLNLLKGTDMKRAMRIRKEWVRQLLPAIGVRIDVQGNIPDYPCILMANHRSYLDPALLVHDVIACPVSKAEVANWPIVGHGARATGVLFLQRESASSRKKTLNGIADKILEGNAVILFPEGTTHADPQCRQFRLGGFKLAAQEQVPIVPVAIEYRSTADYWIGDDTFLAHFVRRFSEKEMLVYVRYGQPIESTDPEYLMEKAQTWINGELKTIQKSFS